MLLVHIHLTLKEYDLVSASHHIKYICWVNATDLYLTLMDFSPLSAAEMIDKLTLTFNRTRQAVITKELIEIISGAAAL